MYRLSIGIALILWPLSAFADVPEFSVDIESIISKAGCNAGTCHGNLNGKGGLRLSLRGQNANFDFHSIALGSRGRRINCAAPEYSLLLLKATGTIAHVGGSRFAVGSAEYQTLRDWIAAGAPPAQPTERKLVGLDVQPSEAIIVAPADSFQVQVTAHFSDGSTRDVTQRACYELSNLSASVDASGVVSRQNYGETTLVVRYLQEQRPIPLAFVAARPDFRWSAPPPNNLVDTHVFAKLQRLRINPSPLCDDRVFVRRAYLDAIGRIPTADEAQDFVFDNDQNKRAELIDGLLARPEFADYWALKWADVLRAEEKVLDPTGVENYHGWIRQQIALARPIDEFVRDLVTGIGSTYKEPAANYYRANRDAVTRGETTARLFLGTRLQCAKCHNHPFDHWTQDDYYQWATLFSQIDYELGENERTDKLDKNEFVGEQIVLVSKQDEIRNPTTGEFAVPKFLGGPKLPAEFHDDRLGALAGWLTDPGNELFANSQTNFIWYQLMGRGLVDPIDDFRATNPASNPRLLDALSAHFVASNFDLRQLVRTIMNSRTYQLSSEPNTTNVDDDVSFSRCLVRRHSAEVILDMQSDVLETPAEFVGYPRGIRAVQIPGVHRVSPRKSAPLPGDRFLSTFGKPERIMACDCERSNETTLKQVFVLVGDGLNERLTASGGRLERLASSDESDSAVIDRLYWTALSRAPTQAELAASLSLLRSPAHDRGAAVEDIAWALLNAKEFLFRR
ncbi:MAG: DUF1549 domain-containing protein [Planctomycetales bacterium]|nr:DUF1549 domain-containing protein [Planctomycetales bacterium]